MGILGVILAQTMWIFERLSREKPPPEWGGVCESHWVSQAQIRYRRNPHRSGEVFVRINSSTDNPACLGRNPHRSGEVFARPAGGSAWKLPLREKPPPERGGVCEAVSANVAHDRIGETPTEVGVLCETLASTASMSTSEKPPPKWVHRHLPQIFNVLPPL